MAEPIQPTPVLTGEDARRVQEELSTHCTREEADRRRSRAKEALAEIERTKDGRRRLEVEFSAEAWAHLKEMAGGRSKGAVIRDALRLYDWYVRNMEEGYALYMAKGDEERMVELDFGPSSVVDSAQTGR